MRKVALVCAVLCYLALLGYLGWLYFQVPPMVPIWSDAAALPYKHEPRDVLFKLVAVGPILPCLGIFLFTKRAPLLSFGACGVVFVTFLLVHAQVRLMLPEAPLPQLVVTPKAALWIASGACLLIMLWLGWAIRTKQDGGPPPEP